MFKLNRKTEYGLLALQYLAGLSNPKMATVREIADNMHIPQPLLAKVLQKLARKQIIRSVQGARGGYVLQEHLESMTLADIIELLEGPIRLTECRTQRACCERMQECNLRYRFEPVQQSLVDVFQRIKVKDLIQEPFRTEF
ncbi:Rrf2 family transcriptional regulator [candidate division KSB1 bacterium]|nr:Rrf2 family transcriptional regulator [candidate division KSB1 bacterium]